MRVGLVAFLAAASLAQAAAAQPAPAKAAPLKADTPLRLSVLVYVEATIGEIQLDGVGFGCRTQDGQTVATLSPSSGPVLFTCAASRLPGNRTEFKWQVILKAPGEQVYTGLTAALSTDDAGRPSVAARIDPTQSANGYRVDIRSGPAGPYDADIGLGVALRAGRACDLDHSCG